MPRLSFRDPDGFVFRSRERIFRCVLPHAVPNLREFLPSGIATAWMEECVLASTAVVPDGSVSELRDVFRDAAYDGRSFWNMGRFRSPTIPMNGRRKCYMPPAGSRCEWRGSLWTRGSA